jgi:DNA-binding transcriptional regulator YiaG
MAEEKPVWHSDSVRSLRAHLGLSQTEMAAELGTRQQTISEWETGVYRPRGTSERLLSLVAERAGFSYETKPPPKRRPRRKER